MIIIADKARDNKSGIEIKNCDTHKDFESILHVNGYPDILAVIHKHEVRENRRPNSQQDCNKL